jgi:hypothetical protein
MPTFCRRGRFLVGLQPLGVPPCKQSTPTQCRQDQTLPAGAPSQRRRGVLGGYLGTFAGDVAGFVLICERDPSTRTHGSDDLWELAGSLAPSNISPARPLLHELPGLTLVVWNPVSAVMRHEGSVSLGTLLDSRESWWKVGSDPPDGSYAICRSGRDSVEVLADEFASRPLWYVQTPDLFLASTSQRAIVRLLGDFTLNARAVSWMLSAGNLGPEDSWDSRLRRVPRGTLLRLDRRPWKLSFSPFVHEDEPDESPIAQADRLETMGAAIAHACEALDVNMDDWRLPLSGGKDSRCLLAYLRRAGHSPRCITWGSDPTRLGKGSDAEIAARVAKAMGVDQQYFRVDRATEPRIDVLRRYVAVGEGLVDHVSAYMDGFAMWRELFESGVVGVVRGEVATGWYDVQAPHQARRSIVPALDDYGAESLIQRLDLPAQAWPDHLRPRSGETPQQHANRLYFEVRLPRVLAGLNHMRSAYVEVSEPLLSRNVASVARRILQTGSAIPVMQDLARREGPAVPLASSTALPSVERCIRDEAVAHEVRRELSSAAAGRVFSSTALELLLTGMDARGSDKGLAWKQVLHVAARIAPGGVLRLGTKMVPVTVPPFQLAFRAYIASRTADVLATDAAASAPEGQRQ